MSANLMYSPLESVFEETMKREGQILKTYYSGTEFRAFFRIRNDNENQRETIVIYYDVTAPVHSGTLIMIGSEVFLALNKETVENDVYYKSTMIKCNGIYNDNDGSVSNVPFYSDNIKSSLEVGNNVLTMLNGNTELLTEENTISKKIDLGQTFNEFGRTFKVTNIYTIDGIVHIISEINANVKPNFVYSIVINGIPTESIKPNETVQLSAIPYINGSETTGATFNWTSSDNSIAIVDNTGKVTSLSEGTVKITVTWIEKDVSEIAYITIANKDVPPTPIYNYSIVGNTNLKNGYARTYTFSVTDSEGTIVNNIEPQWNVMANFEVDQTIFDDKKIKLKVNNEDLIDNTFVLQALVDGEVKAEITIRIVE